jgi:hypothetical protein
MVHSVYKTYDRDLPLHSIYLYYFSPTKDDAVYQDFGANPVPRTAIPAEIASLVTRIKRNDPNLIHTKECERRSCFAVVLDEAGLKLEKDNAVKIRWLPIPSRAFRDGEDVPVVAGHTNATAFFCINHMRHIMGHVLRTGERERFSVTLVHNRGSFRRFLLTRWLGFYLLLGWLLSILDHDDVGTNTGPPIGPP